MLDEESKSRRIKMLDKISTPPSHVGPPLARGLLGGRGLEPPQQAAAPRARGLGLARRAPRVRGAVGAGGRGAVQGPVHLGRAEVPQQLVVDLSASPRRASRSRCPLSVSPRRACVESIPAPPVDLAPEDLELAARRRVEAAVRAEARLPREARDAREEAGLGRREDGAGLGPRGRRRRRGVVARDVDDLGPVARGVRGDLARDPGGDLCGTPRSPGRLLARAYIAAPRASRRRFRADRHGLRLQQGRAFGVGVRRGRRRRGLVPKEALVGRAPVLDGRLERVLGRRPRALLATISNAPRRESRNVSRDARRETWKGVGE